MKLRRHLPILATLAFTHTAFAADITWDTSNAFGIQGGAGTWNTSTTNWTTDDGDTNIAWDNTSNATDTAVFTTSVGTVTISDTINLGGLRFTIGGSSGYNLTGGTLDFGSAQGSIDTSALANTSDNITTVSTSLTGTGGLTIAANGDQSATGGTSNTALLLHGDNSGLSGGITITSGLVSYNSTNSFGTNTITLNGGGIVNRNAGPFTLANDFVIGANGGVFRNWGNTTGATTFTGGISGSGEIRKTDGGTMRLSPTANSAFSGNFIVDGGTVAIGTNFQATGTGALTVNTGASLNSFAPGSSSTVTYGNSAIAINGATWNFGGSSPGNVTHTYNFAGGELGSASATDPATAIQITNGTLNFSSSNTTTKAFNGRINWSGNNIINRTSSNFTHTTNWNRAWYGDGTITINKTGGATGRAMNFNGAGSAFSGTVILNNTQASGGNDPVFNLNQSMGATTFEVRNRWNLRNNEAGALDEAVAVTVTHTASRLTLLQTVNNSALALTVNNGGVNIGAGASTIGNLAGAGGFVNGTDATSALAVTQTSNASYAGEITGDLALEKAGSATLTLSGTSAYTGDTIVSAGTLLITGSLTDSNVSVADGAAIGGSGSIGGTLALAGGSFLEVVDFDDPLSVTGTITFGSGFGIASLTGFNWDSLDLDTPYTILSTSQNFSSLNIENFGSANAASVGGGRFAYFQNGSLDFVVVIPEPSTALAGILLGLGLLRRRRP